MDVYWEGDPTPIFDSSVHDWSWHHLTLIEDSFFEAHDFQDDNIEALRSTAQTSQESMQICIDGKLFTLKGWMPYLSTEVSTSISKYGEVTDKMRRVRSDLRQQFVRRVFTRNKEKVNDSASPAFF